MTLPPRRGRPQDLPSVELQPASEIRTERVRWLWRDRIPLRGLTVIAGEKGLGKSILTNGWLVAEITWGALPGDLIKEPGDVAIVTAEDDWASVVRPRLDAHGADHNRVHRVRTYESEIHRDHEDDTVLTLPDHIGALEAAVLNLNERTTVRMIVIDPIGAFLAESTDSHKDAHVRRALAPLAAMAERLDLAIVVVAHLTKDDSRRLIQRVSGAGAFVNAARSVLALVRAPDDPDGEHGRERVLAHVASNWGRQAPSLAALIEGREVDLDDGSRDKVGRLGITGETDITVDELQRPAEDGDDCDESITSRLVDGPRPSREVKAEVAAELEISRKTVERHAVRLAKGGQLKIRSSGFPRQTMWSLPKAPGGTTQSGRHDMPWSVPTDGTASTSQSFAHSSASRDSGDTPAGVVGDVSTDGSSADDNGQRPDADDDEPHDGRDHHDGSLNVETRYRTYPKSQTPRTIS